MEILEKGAPVRIYTAVAGNALKRFIGRASMGNDNLSITLSVFFFVKIFTICYYCIQAIPTGLAIHYLPTTPESLKK